jgi:hypothetical protein
MIDGRSVGIYSYDNVVHDSVVENQLGGIEKHTKDGTLAHDGP